MIVCAGGIELINGAVPIGIGPIESAINLTRICTQQTPTEITFIGSAGSHGGIGLLETVYSNQATNIEHAYFFESGYTPIKSQIVPHGTIINSSSYITTDEIVSKKYLDMGIGIENMEFFSVCEVAKSFGIKATGIFVVTNFCNKSAHEDFKKNHKEAIKILEDGLERWKRKA